MKIKFNKYFKTLQKPHLVGSIPYYAQIKYFFAYSILENPSRKGGAFREITKKKIFSGHLLRWLRYWLNY
jgi:hypothetical protein